MKEFGLKYKRYSIIWICLLLILWEGTVQIIKPSPYLLPSVGQVIKALFHSLIYENLFIQSFFSLGIILLGLLISLLFALLLLLLSEYSVLVKSLAQTMIAIAHPLPGLALLPLIILWFGAGFSAVLAIVIHSAVWPLMLGLFAAFETVPKVLIQTGQNLSLSKLEIAVSIKLRYCIVHLIAGLKIGWARAFRAFISAEMVFGALGGKGGLGWYMFQQRTFMKTDGLFAGLLVIVVMGILVENLFFSWLEKKFSKDTEEVT